MAFDIVAIWIREREIYEYCGILWVSDLEVLCT
jgi:hypothetical protein